MTAVVTFSGKPERLWRHLLGHRLRALRRARQETLGAVARRANLSVQYLSEVERGVKEPSSEVVAAIAAALETTLLDLTAAVAEQLREERTAAPVAPHRGDFTLAA
ncbi:helix-turn-helix domain-containing protein [uncultured Amnibacterium sp.]|uniref:helix-turn-helix domain-containing protein n=1 Tax=uncultured Amnibacterium sp. TaxID=1631851 RepID=UPI0035CAFD53